MLLSGCIDNKITDVNTTSSEYIGFSSNTAVTRASIATLGTLQNDPDGFKVYASHGNNAGWYTDINGHSINGANKYAYNGSSWNFTDPVKWPTTSGYYPMKFYACYPTRSAEGLGTLTSQGVDIVAPYTVLPTGSQVDLLAAANTVNARPASGIVPLVFRHILSQIDFGIIAGAGTKPFIQSIYVDSVKYADTHNFTSQSWMGLSQSGVASYPYFGSLQSAVVIPVFSPAVCDDNTPNAIYSGAHNNHLMLLPQTSPSWQPSGATPAGGFISVIYRMETGHSTGGFGTSREVGFASATSHPDYAVHGSGYTGPLFVKAGFPFPQDASHNFTWDIGRHYTYNIGLGTRSSCNGYILDEYYYDNQGRRTALRLIEVRNEGKHTGDKLQNGVIHVTLDIDNWNEDGGEVRPPSIINLMPSVISLNQTAHVPAISYLTVESNDQSLTWRLSVASGAQSWLRISTNPAATFASASTSINGTGDQPQIYIYTTANNATGATIRNGVITLTLTSSSGSVAGTGECTVTQLNVAPPSGTVSSRGSCVGAFWRYNQIGERIVQINVPSGSSAAGAWTASVVAYDGRWDPFHGDGVLLTSTYSPDPNINTAYPGNAEDYDLLGHGYTSVVSGVATAGGSIYFRIGLQKKFTAYSNNPDYSGTFPARYAVIELLYGNPLKSQKIYLRQGEGDDFVMDNRPLARKISPYNLTAGTLNAPINYNSPKLNPGIFTDFPTKVGAYFQFASKANPRYAWDPYTASFPNWVNANDAWDNNRDECCPGGYRRPSHSTASNTIQPDNSEMCQSLWKVPSQANPGTQPAPIVAENYIYGFYADGYFDRHKAVVHNAGQVNETTGIVAEGTYNVACGGGIFFNPNTLASLFFPVTGYRNASDGSLTSYQGIYGYYLTSWIALGSGYALSLKNEGFVVVNYISNAQGSSIRCIRVP